MSKDIVCLTPNCGRKVQTCGLCGKCYYQARKLVEEGRTTWEFLAAHNLADLNDKALLTAFLRIEQQEKERGKETSQEDGNKESNAEEGWPHSKAISRILTTNGSHVLKELQIWRRLTKGRETIAYATNEETKKRYWSYYQQDVASYLGFIHHTYVQTEDSITDKTGQGQEVGGQDSTSEGQEKEGHQDSNTVNTKQQEGSQEEISELEHLDEGRPD